MRVLSVDPSATRIGWAFFVTGHPDRVLDRAGVLRPHRTRDEWTVRLASMVDQLVRLFDEQQTDAVVIEVPSGTAAAGTTGRMGGYLAIYGAAVGAVWQAMRYVSPVGPGELGRVQTVTEREWTRSVPKERRAAWLRREYPGLDWAGDHGLDMADAIGLGLWWIQREAFQQAVGGSVGGSGLGEKPRKRKRGKL